MMESAYIKEIQGPDDFARLVIDASHEQPVLVDFWADWCGPCQVLMPVLASLVDEYQGAVRLAKVNSDEQQALATQHGVRSLPTVKLFKNGVVVDEFTGAQPESVIRGIIERHVDKESDHIRGRALAAAQSGDVDGAERLLREALDLDPAHLEARLDLAKIQAGRGDLTASVATLDELPASAADDASVLELRAKLRFASTVQHAPPLESLASAVADGSATAEQRYQLAAHEIMRGDYAAALDQLLIVMGRHRDYDDDAGRKAMLEVFALLGSDHPLVKTYRGRMFALLH